MKHLVQWYRPEPVLIGKKQPLPGEYLYRSKCGRFTIYKVEFDMPTRSNGYKLIDVVVPENSSRTHDHASLADAKYAADLAVDPNFDPDGAS